MTVAVLGLEPLPLLDQRLMQAVELVSVRPEFDFTSSSQCHCATLASISEVGVSALNSSSLGGPLPSQARSKRPNSEG